MFGNHDADWEQGPKAQRSHGFQTRIKGPKQEIDLTRGFLHVL